MGIYGRSILEAFFNSGLWNVSVPESVTDIGKNAFVKKGGQTISFPIQ